jgi:tripartite-type tricarboxylate transporter receptor subunit TctC
MKLPQREFLHLAAGAAALSAQSYPSRPVRLIVGFPAGGIVDLFAGQPEALTNLLGGQVQVTFDPLANSIEHIRAGRLSELSKRGCRIHPCRDPA